MLKPWALFTYASTRAKYASTRAFKHASIICKQASTECLDPVEKGVVIGMVCIVQELCGGGVSKTKNYFSFLQILNIVSFVNFLHSWWGQWSLQEMWPPKNLNRATAISVILKTLIFGFFWKDLAFVDRTMNYLFRGESITSISNSFVLLQHNGGSFLRKPIFASRVGKSQLYSIKCHFS